MTELHRGTLYSTQLLSVICVHLNNDDDDDDDDDGELLNPEWTKRFGTKYSKVFSRLSIKYRLC